MESYFGGPYYPLWNDVSPRLCISVDTEVGKNIPLNSNVHSTELNNGCDLLIYSCVDSFVVGKHTHILEIIGGVSVSTKGYSNNLPLQHNLIIVSFLYSYDNPHTGETYLLEFNHCIYLGKDKNDAIVCPNQMRVNGV